MRSPRTWPSFVVATKCCASHHIVSSTPLASARRSSGLTRAGFDGIIIPVMPAVPQSTPVEPQAPTRDQQILDAALALFAERGFHGTSIPLVMERAGVGASALYRRFESKEALVNAVFRDAKGRLDRALRDGLDMTQPPRPLFDELWARLIAFAQGEPDAFRFLELQDHTPYLDNESRMLELSVLAPIYLSILDFQRRGAMRSDIPGDVVMASMWGAFVGIFKAERTHYLKLNEQALAAARDACWRAFATDPPASSAARDETSQTREKPREKPRRKTRARKKATR